MRDYFPGVTALTQRVNTELATEGYYSIPPPAIDGKTVIERPLPILENEAEAAQRLQEQSTVEPLYRLYDGPPEDTERTNFGLAVRAIEPLVKIAEKLPEPEHVVKRESARHRRQKNILAANVIRRCRQTMNIRKRHSTVELV